METIINCSDIGFSYNGTNVLNGISLSIQPGNMLGILGANGAGKSTLLKILCGVLKPKIGSAVFNDQELSKMDRREIAKGIAYIPQDPMFAFPFTVKEIVLMGRAPYIGRFEFERDIDKDIALNALETVGISHLKDRLISEVSSGERQLASIARGLVQEPEIMILDEPATYLDVKHRTEIMNILRELKDNKGISIIAATHDIFSSLFYFDDIMILKDGNTLAEGKSDQIIDSELLSSAYGIEVTVKKENGRVFVFPNQ
ncbi:MAG: ABC transporter ATP-binding protein [Thermodesulfobacteriota bacterium]|nr:MAG: ABC transporter ATP-binding protein [Thermodesulfobacteriota bacterium]